jgi:alpha-glucosidase
VPGVSPEDNLPWWAGAVVYQVYPRSFADSDGDGIGDLRGLITRLPYLDWLGVDAIWLTPCYPSPLLDGGYDVADYTDIDPRLGTLRDFDELVGKAETHGIRVLVDLVPNHCSADHPLFRKALAAPPGGDERELFIFREGRGPGGAEPPNNWPSRFGGSAWTRVPDGQWYLHMYDASQPDWNWRDPRVGEMFAEILRFWLGRGVAGFRVDVAHGLFKDPDLADVADPRTSHPAAYCNRPEVHPLYRSWREILDGWSRDRFPGARTAVGEVWTDSVDALRPYLAPGGLPQIFNFQLVRAQWSAGSIRSAIDATHTFADGSRAPWVIGNHDVRRPVTRWGSAAARAAALLQLALPGSAYVYQGEELGLPEVLDIPDAARQDPVFRRTNGQVHGRDGARVPLPWDEGGPSFGFSRTDRGVALAPPWLPQPPDWGDYGVAAQRDDPASVLSLYRAALLLRRAQPAFGSGALRWLATPDDVLAFARDPGFVCAVNFGPAPFPLPPYREVLLASGPLAAGPGGSGPGGSFPGGDAGGGEPEALPRDTAVWLAT